MSRKRHRERVRFSPRETMQSWSMRSVELHPVSECVCLLQSSVQLDVQD